MTDRRMDTGRSPVRILVSILNWNAATQSIAAATSALAAIEGGGLTGDVVVIDNGSRPDDVETLQRSDIANRIAIVRSPVNLGFASGHNLSIARARREGYDFVWLLNNDAIAEPEALSALVDGMAQRPRCGAMSPVLMASDNASVYDFCGASSDWRRLDCWRATNPAQAVDMEARCPADTWVAGTAVLYRTAALDEVGPLCDKLFAYYEDNDICARLSAAGWTSLLWPTAKVLHSRHVLSHHERPPYYFYLMVRNAFYFWLQHTPRPFRRWLRYRLACRGFIIANRMQAHGSAERQRACLLGVEDGLRGRWGAPDLDRSPTWLVRTISRHYAHRIYTRIEAMASHAP